MFALKHKETGKYVSLSEDCSKLTTEKTLRTATVFPMQKMDAVKAWLLAGNVLNAFSIVPLSGLDCITEAALVRIGRCKYSEIKKISNNAWEVIV